ncbi:putative 35.5 kDa protein in transposon Tn4556 [Prunus yedoensis var. nudiflora]|uniref:Putative 35.5 kDa protein in transposon Tn4556 n=1 Tax=Prunus yedoensis var. nudiflora TaxID=2094558 RepID=A0A314YUA6_PRUYE|nr:putative 35.5 kDa protein in transposon Tn4556 [Prunus yedoensis var. nudiflora]
MGDPPRSASTSDLYSMLGISNICKGYKSFVMKLSPNHHHKNGESKFTDNHETTKEEENFTISYPTTPIGSFGHQRSIDDSFFSRRSLSRIGSRRCKTPTPRTFSRSASRSTTPTPTTLLRDTSLRQSSETEISASISRNMSRRQSSETKTSASLSRNMSRRSTSETEFHASLSRNMSHRRPSETEIPSPSPAASSVSAPASPAPASPSRTLSPLASRTSGTSDQPDKPSTPLSRSISKRSPTPIVFSRTTARKKALPVEKRLGFTLEQLCHGCVKKIKLTRDVINDAGIIVQEEEVLQINVQPGWRKGTKITFQGKGDEKPGYLPADIVFLIDEKRHPLYKRSGRDDLEMAVEIPLVDALGGCSFPVPLLGGDKMKLSFDDIIYHGYEKVIQGQGMPLLKEPARRGDLRITCLINFPTTLSDEERAEAVNILQDCSYD